MKTLRIEIACVALLLACGTSGAAFSQPGMATLRPAIGVALSVRGPVGVDFFYNNLSPYGQWVERPSYGWVWLPHRVRHGWRPYTLGRWVYSDYGWTWVSSEPWGWATYHYGRWNNDPDYGWTWVPGTDWGPAWVAWQHGDGYVGWAPLPPAVGFSAGVGLELGGFDLSAGIAPYAYSFCPERSFLATSVAAYIVPPARNVTIIRNTTNITNYRMVNNRVINQGVPVQRIEQVTGRPVRRLQLAELKSARPGSAERVRGNQVSVFRPAVVKRAEVPPPPAQARASRQLSQGRLASQQKSEARALDAQHSQEARQLASIHRRELRNAPAHQPAAVREKAAPAPRGPERALSSHEKAASAAPARQQAVNHSAQAAHQAATREELAQRHAAETKALQEQHQRDRQQLDARHSREQQAVAQAQSRPRQPAPEPKAAPAPPPRQAHPAPPQRAERGGGQPNQPNHGKPQRPRDGQNPPPGR